MSGGIAVRGMRALIWAYRMFVSPLLGSNCRFMPTCSQYADQAIARFGAWHGTFLAVRRILRCHPWGGYGADPVPQVCTSSIHRERPCGDARH